MKNHGIISLGAGVQSTLLYLWACQGPLKYLHRERDKWGRTTSKEWREMEIECAIFADTGDEPAPVYKHLEWLQSLGGVPIMVRRRSKNSLGDNLINGIDSTGQRFVSIPAFTKEEGRVAPGIVRRQCTSEYKISVIQKTIRQEICGLKKGQRMPKDIHVHSFIGMSSDEGRRVGNVMSNKTKWETPHFPLYDLGMNREKCKTELLKLDIPHLTPRSACTFCPYRSNMEWANLINEDQKGFESACKIDRRIRDHDARCNKSMNNPMYLHRSCVPLDSIDFLGLAAEEALLKAQQPELFDGFEDECLGMCGL